MAAFSICRDNAGADSIAFTISGVPLTNGRVALLRAILTASPYQIAAGSNTFTLRESTPADFVVTLTPGNYTGIAAATHIATQIAATAATNTYSVTFNPSTGYLTIARTAGAVTFGLQLAATPRMAAIMGFAATNFAATSTTVTSTMPVRLQASFYYLVSQTLNAGFTATIADDHRIAILGADNGAYQITSTTLDQMVWYTPTTQNLVFSLVDEFGGAVLLNGGMLAIQVLIRA